MKMNKIYTKITTNSLQEMKRNGDFCYFFNYNNEIEFINSIKYSEENNSIKKLEALILSLIHI